MPHFDYQIIDNSGQAMKGRVLAESKNEAYNKLRALGFVITSLDENKTGITSNAKTNTKPIKLSVLIIFTKQIAALLKSGIPITKSLSSISQQMEDKNFANIILSVVGDVERGLSLSQALKKNAKGALDDQFYALIEVGELSGNLDATFEKLSVQLQKQKQIQDTIKQATFYPKMVLGFAGFVFLGLVVFIVPVFRKMIPPTVPLPGITKAVFSLSDSLRAHWYWYIVVIIVIFIGVFKMFPKSPMGRQIWEKLKFKMPLFGIIIHKSCLARFARTAATLLDCGVQVITAFQNAGMATGSSLIGDSVNDATKMISQGSNIASTLEKYPFIYPQLMIQMIEIGETSGSLPWMLDRVAEFYEDETSSQTKKLSSVIEPLMLVLIAIIVGGMLISLYLPMFTMIVHVA